MAMAMREAAGKLIATWRRDGAPPKFSARLSSVGADAHKIDEMVRQSPERAYDIGFFDEFARAAGWPDSLENPNSARRVDHRPICVQGADGRAGDATGGRRGARRAALAAILAADVAG